MLSQDIDIEILDRLVDKKTLVRQFHPTLPLVVFNYSRDTQYNRNWTNYTLASRCLILDRLTGKVVSRSFPKFFNLDEGTTATQLDRPFEILPKMDGSLISVFKYRDEIVVASKGSFTSWHADRAMELILPYRGIIKTIFEGSDVTLCFELYGTENRIVVSYSDTPLALIGLNVVDNRTGRLNGRSLFSQHSLPCVESVIVKDTDGIPITDITGLRKIQDRKYSNIEGYVLEYSDTELVKFKFNEYVKLHKVLTNLSTTVIWDHLRSDTFYQYIREEFIPDEYYDWIRTQEHKLSTRYEEETSKLKKEGDRIKYELYKLIDASPVSSKLLNRYIRGDREEIADLIWDSIKPSRETP